MLTYLLELQWISLSTGIGATLNTKSLFHPTCLRSILANVSTTRFATFENVHSWKVQISKPGKLVVTLLHLVSHLLTVSKAPGCLSAIFTRSQKCPEWMLETADTLSAPGFVHNNSESPILSSAAIFLSGVTYQSYILEWTTYQFQRRLNVKTSS